jgi:hypothetical protein
MISLSSGRYTCRRSSISLSDSDDVVVAVSVVVIVVNTDSVVFDFDVVDLLDDFG